MPRKRMTIEKCHEIALKYETRSDFRKYDYNVYNLACGYHWLDKVCKHMKRTGNKFFRCIYVYEFPDNYAYIGLTYNLKIRNSNRKTQSNDAVINHIRKTGLHPILKQLSNYVLIDVAKALETDCIEFYENIGWKMLNITKGGEVGSIPNKWTKEKCQIEALVFNTRTKFKEKKYGAYMAAKENGWLDEICSYMIFINTHRTFEDCKITALKYKTKPEFFSNDSTTYSWAQRKGFLDEICSHMIRKYKPYNYWTKERTHEEALKYDSKNEFFLHAGGAHDAAKRNGWLDEIRSHMINKII